MKFNVDELDSLMTALNFNHFPRTVGNLRQQTIYATEEIWPLFSKWDGNASCFISTTGHDNITYEQGGKQTPQTLIHEMTFFDFDHDTKPENAFADAQRLSSFLTNMDIAHWVQYSGSKGYHVFILHAPTRFRFKWNDGSGDALKQILHQTQNHLRQSLGLNTLDEQTMGDPKRLCRFPFTHHIDRFGKSSGRYCVPVETSSLDSIAHSDIVASAYRPTYRIPTITGRRVTIKQFIRELGIKLHAPETQLRPIIDGDIQFSDAEAETLRYMSSLEHRCMGVVNELKRRNPPHKARVYSALFAKTLGITQPSFEKIWLELGKTIGYVDLHNTQHRQYQMATLFNDPRFQSFPNCTTLKANGCCVGEICPRYREFVLGEKTDVPQRTIERKWRLKE